jgi:hypothetical protein
MPGEVPVNTSEKVVVQVEFFHFTTYIQQLSHLISLTTPYQAVPSCVCAGNNTQIQPATPSTCLAGVAGNWNTGQAGLRASARNSPRGLQCEHDFESDDRDDSIIFVDSGNEDPILRFSVKKEPHKFSDFNALEYHETAEPPTPPCRHSMSPVMNHPGSTFSRNTSVWIQTRLSGMGL